MSVRIGCWTVWARVIWFAAAMLAACEFCSAADQPAAPLNSANSGLYVKVQLDKPIKLSKLRAGDVVEGNLVRDVFSADHELFAAHNRLRLLVDHMEKRRRARNDHWPWVIKVFSPRHENYPVFTTATVSGTDGQSLLRVSLISVSRLREVHAQVKKQVPGQPVTNGPAAIEVGQPSGEHESNKRKASVIVLEASTAQGEEPLVSETRSGIPPQTAKSDNVPENVPAGTACKILLLGDVSASRSKPGDMVQARLLEPVLLDSRLVLPAGSLFQGKVAKRTPPRWGSRAGSLAIAFTGLTLPGGDLQSISASVAGAELDRRSHTRIDAEGRLHGEHPGKAWMAINIAVTAGLAKEADDTLQLIVEALVSSATDVSTAGAGRIVSACVSGIFMVTRHGRDVVLPRFTEMEIAFDRPVSVTRSAEAGPSVNLVHGN